MVGRRQLKAVMDRVGIEVVKFMCCVPIMFGSPLQMPCTRTALVRALEHNLGHFMAGAHPDASRYLQFTEWVASSLLSPDGADLLCASDIPVGRRSPPCAPCDGAPSDSAGVVLLLHDVEGLTVLSAALAHTNPHVVQAALHLLGALGRHPLGFAHVVADPAAPLVRMLQVAIALGLARAPGGSDVLEWPYTVGGGGGTPPRPPHPPLLPFQCLRLTAKSFASAPSVPRGLKLQGRSLWVDGRDQCLACYRRKHRVHPPRDVLERPYNHPPPLDPPPPAP